MDGGRLSKPDRLIIEIDRIHIKEDLALLAAVSIDGDGGKQPLGVIKGPPRMLRWCRRSWTTWSGVGSTRRSAAC